MEPIKCSLCGGEMRYHNDYGVDEYICETCTRVITHEEAREEYLRSDEYLQKQFEEAGKFYAKNDQQEYRKWIVTKSHIQAIKALQGAISQFNNSVNKLLK